MVLSIAMASHELMPYFQAHPIIVIINHPMKTTLGSLNILGRMMKWAAILTKYDTQFKPQTTVKKEITASLLIELSVSLPSSRCEVQDFKIEWSFYVEGTSSEQGARAGIVCNTLDGIITQRAIKFEFPASNNEVEYEAHVLGLQLTQELRASILQVYSDSQLTIIQIEENMKFLKNE